MDEFIGENWLAIKTKKAEAHASAFYHYTYLNPKTPWEHSR